MDERDETPIIGRSENELLMKAAIGVIAATSPIWIPWVIFFYLDIAGEDGPASLFVAGCCSIGAFVVWLVVRWLNRQDDPRRAMCRPEPVRNLGPCEADSMTDRKKPGVAFWVIAVLVAVLAYGGAYLCMADRPVSILYSGFARGPFEVPPVYGHGLAGQNFWRAIFGPAHWIDTRVRPELWTDTLD
jgi:hypothetical protein